MVNKIGPYRNTNRMLEKFNLKVSVVKPKTQELVRNIHLDLKGDSEKEVEDPSYYDNFANYLQYSYDKYITPLYANICKIGDVVTLDGEVDEELYFNNDECTVSVIISIPNNHKQSWQTYVAKYYKDLTKFDDYFDSFVFHVRDYQVQQVEFKFKFEMEQKQTIKYLNENNGVQQEAIGFWLSTFNVIEKKVQSDKFHTNTIPVERVMTEYGPRAKFCSETIKLKL